MADQQLKGITILGLGPGEWHHLTIQAENWLETLDEIYLRTEQHPVVKSFPSRIAVHSFDALYEQSETFEDVYAQIVREVIELGKRPQGVTYAVPGHPYVAEATSPEIVRIATDMGLPVRVIAGLSFIEPTLSLIGVDLFPETVLVDALDMGDRNYPSFNPTRPVLIAQIYSRMVASEVKLTLMNVYPDDHSVYLVHDAGDEHEKSEKVSLYEIDRSEAIGLRTVLYVPPLPEDRSFESFQELVARLRAPDGCPWDRKQTHKSLIRYLLEEAYELIDALEKDDIEKISEELGDLLLQIMLHAQIGLEEGEFNMSEILSGIYRKIVRRHPHVFGQENAENAEDVVVTWERVKAEERQEMGKGENGNGILDGLPLTLPALSQAQEVQTRAGRVGFDWDSITPVFDKVKEEFEEILQAKSQSEIENEIGDLLFAVVNLARWLGVDAETALRMTSARFRSRFQHIEHRAEELKLKLTDMNLDEMDRFWEEAKKMENGEDSLKN